ncbi:MAG: 5'-3' exonuclease [Ardenticatenaceae bacterium]
MSHTFLLVDGHSMAFRAFYALPDSIRDPNGESVQAVYGFLSILFGQISELNAEFVAITFDVGRSLRESWFADYKAGRQEIDPDVQRQVEHLQEVLKALAIPIYVAEGYEADDIIATLVRQAAAQEDLHTIVLSGDRDLFGVIGPRTTILYPTRSIKKAERYDAARLYKRWAIEPRQVADFKALVGDSSDNIPGVRGIGEKTAAKLLQQFGTLEEIYANLEQITSKRARNALTTARQNAFLSQRLAQLIDNVPNITFDRPASRLEYHRPHVEEIFDRFGFQNLRKRLP